MSFKIVIPARYGSSRLPGKPLRDIAGKPMIQHVYERAMESQASQVIIATDDQRILEISQQFAGQVCMTSPDHPSGTDRLAEVAQQYQFDDDDIIINLQGDEPCLPASLIDQVAQDLTDYPDADIATLYQQITDKDQLFNPNVVKVVLDQQGYAIYFSRAPIPWLREHFPDTDNLPVPLPHKRHIGLYGYRASFLNHYKQLSACELEQVESLEQLRALYQGCKIHLSEATIEPGHGVDTEQDLLAVQRLLGQ